MDLTTPRRVIFDTDPGVDDALALFFLLRSPELTLDAVTTVYGNVDVEQTTRNALILLDVAGRPDIPVAAGAGRPLMRPPRLSGVVVHGDNGLGGAVLPEPSRGVVPRRAAELIVERVMAAAPGEITIIAVGPLTNIALATSLEPRIVERVHELIVMGGAVTVPGNVTPLAEANIHNDAEAAAIVFSAGYKLALIGLDVTLKALISPAQVETIRQHGGRVGEFTHAVSSHYGQHYIRRTGWPGFPMHDSAAILYAIDPGYFTSERWYLEVETHSPRAYGMVMADRRGRWGQPPNADVPLEIDSARFLDLYMERLARPE
ncbi:MAG: nucleoside hydrolase [Chloroflexi bacterium]|nr:nucleoside hydrolase [Chloroflexota bacterium]